MFFLNYSEIIKNIKYFVERTIYIYIEIYIYLFILQKHYISPLKVKESFLWLCCSFFLPACMETSQNTIFQF